VANFRRFDALSPAEKAANPAKNMNKIKLGIDTVPRTGLRFEPTGADKTINP